MITRAIRSTYVLFILHKHQIINQHTCNRISSESSPIIDKLIAINSNLNITIYVFLRSETLADDQVPMQCPHGTIPKAA